MHTVHLATHLHTEFSLCLYSISFIGAAAFISSAYRHAVSFYTRALYVGGTYRKIVNNLIIKVCL